MNWNRIGYGRKCKTTIRRNYSVENKYDFVCGIKENIYICERLTNKIVENMSNLVNKLQAETQSFRAVYLEKVEQWARGEFNAWSERSTFNDEQWCQYYGLEPRFVPGRFGGEDYTTFPANFHNQKIGGQYYKDFHKARTIANKGLENFVAKEIENGEIHFQNSLLKLADRISKKGLNEKSLTVTSAHVNVNLEITITDGSKTVRAFTIIASGEVQRPHYRYLIK